MAGPLPRLLLWLLVALPFVSDAGQPKRGSAAMPPLLSKIHRATEVPNVSPRLVPAGFEHMTSRTERYEKFCLNSGAFDTSFKYSEFGGHNERPELGAEQFMLHMAYKATDWVTHRKPCLYTVNTFPSVSISAPEDATHIYGAVRLGLVRLTASYTRSFRNVALTIHSTAPGPMAISIPQGTIFEGNYTEQPLVVAASVMVHILPTHKVDVMLSTYSMSLTGQIPSKTSQPRLTPFIYMAGFLREFQNESPRSQLILWGYTDRGRHVQLNKVRKQWVPPLKQGDWPTTILLFLCVWFGQAVYMQKCADKESAPTNFCFATVFTVMVSGVYQLGVNPEVLLQLLFAGADVSADNAVLLLGLCGALGLLLCAAPSHPYLVKDHASYAILFAAVGIWRYTPNPQPQLATCCGALFPLQALYLPVMLMPVFALPVLARRKKAAVAHAFRHGLPALRGVVFPFFGAPMVVAAASLLREAARLDLLETIDAFVVDPVAHFKLPPITHPHVLLALALWFLCASLHAYTRMQNYRPLEKEKSK